MKYRKGNFVTVPNKALLKGQLPSTQVVFLWLCSYADEEGVCFPSRARLADDAGITMRTVDSAIKQLEDLGLLFKTQRVVDNEKKTSEYEIMEPEQVGSATIALPSATNTLPPPAMVAHRTVSTLSNSIHLTSEAEASQKISLEEFMETKGYHEVEIPVDGDSADIVTKWAREDGRVLSTSAFAPLEREWRKKYGDVLDEKPPRKRAIPEIEQVFYLFKDINLAWESWRVNKTQRFYAQALLDKGMDIPTMANILKKTKELKGDFVPQVFTPQDLFTKYSKIEAEVIKQKGRMPKTFAEMSGEVKL